MKVDFNNLRRKTGEHFNKVIKALNTCEQCAESDGRPADTEYLRDSLDYLRTDIIGLLCCYEEGNPECEVIDIDLLSAFLDEEDEE